VAQRYIYPTIFWKQIEYLSLKNIELLVSVNLKPLARTDNQNIQGT
jgi:hypothetical protein